MSKLKVGVVGLGLMGFLHARVYSELASIELVGGYDVSPGPADKFATEYGVKKFNSLQELLNATDAVSICTPDHLHVEAALSAFERGVKCLIEKPLATSAADCDKIISAMPGHEYLMVGHILRFDPRINQARRAVMSGALGKLCCVNIWRNNSRAGGAKIGGHSSSAWFLGIHDIDAVHFITGEKVVKVSAAGKKFFTPHYDYVAATLELNGGAVVTMENSFLLPDERVSGLDSGVKIIGECGMIEIDMNHSDARLTTLDMGRSLMQDTYHWPLIGDNLYGDLRTELEAFTQAVISGKTPPVTGEEAAEAVKVIERIMSFLDAQNA